MSTLSNPKLTWYREVRKFFEEQLEEHDAEHPLEGHHPGCWSVKVRALLIEGDFLFEHNEDEHNEHNEDEHNEHNEDEHTL